MAHGAPGEPGVDTNYDHLMDKALATTADQRNELYAANKSLRAQNATLLKALKEMMRAGRAARARLVTISLLERRGAVREMVTVALAQARAAIEEAEA